MVEKRVFTGGMDSDTDDRLVQQGDYRRALNLRVMSSDNDNIGAVENTKGNVLVVNGDLPSGVNVCIGAHRSEQRDSIIYFVWNSNASHGIYEYDYESDSISTILISDILNFDRQHLITGVNDIEGLLYWTDDLNQPRKINIDKAKRFSESGGSDPSGYSSLIQTGTELEREKFINTIKAQPEYAPNLEFFTDPSRAVNNVRNKFFRFRYRYVYDDNETSAWSEPSKISYSVADFISDDVTLSTTSLSQTTNYLDIQKTLNGIRIDLNASHETVRKIEVSVAEGFNDYFLWRTFDKQEEGWLDNQDVDVEFFNDSVLTPLDVNESIKPFDDVPLKAKAQAIIEGNKLAYGNYVTGYDSIPIDVGLKPIYKEATSLQGSSGFSDVPFGNSINIEQFGSYFIESGTVGSLTDLGGVVETLYNIERWDITLDSFRDSLIDSGYDVTDNSFVEVNFSLGGEQQPYANENNSLNLISVFIPPLENTDFDDAYHFLYDVLFNSFLIDIEDNSFQDFTGQYGDDNNIDGIIYKQRMLDISQYADNTQQNRLRFFDYVNFADDFFPPDVFADPQFNNGWWLYQQNSANISRSRGSRGVRSFSLRTVSVDDGSFTTFKSGAKHSFGLVYYDAYGRSSFVNVSQDCEVYVKSIPERNIDEGGYDNLIANIVWQIDHDPPEWATHYAWVYAGNNRTRDFEWIPIVSPNFMGDSEIEFFTGSTINASLSVLQRYQERVDETLLSYDWAEGDRAMFITAPNEGEITPSGVTRNWRRTDEEQIIDIPVLNQKVDSDEVIVSFPRFGNDIQSEIAASLVEFYSPIKTTDEEQRLYYTLSEKYPILGGQHSVTSGVFTRGDVYLRPRIYRIGTTDYTFVVESASINDSVFSKFYDRGKAYTVDPDQGQTRYIDQVTYSDPFVVGSKINGLSNFNPVELPFKEYGRVYGSIQRLFAFENRLEVYQQDKVQYSMVSRDVIYNNQGDGSTVGTLSNTLSDPVAYSGEYGISDNPESFSVYGSRRYFVDLKRGVVCRLSQNGIEPISDYKMTSYFRNKFEGVIRGYRRANIYGVYDPRFSEYVLSIENRDITQGELQGFSLVDGDPSTIQINFEGAFLPDVGLPLSIQYTGADGNTYNAELTLDSYQTVFDPLGNEFTIVYATLPEGLNLFGSDSNSITNRVLDGDTYSIGVRTVSGETLAFNENVNRWTTFYSYQPEFMVRMFNDIVTFKDGQFWLHNKNEVRNNFYGDQFDSEIWVVSNNDPSRKKIYKAISEESNSVFEAYEITNPSGQLSNLVADDFVEKEGYYYADFLFDVNTPSTIIEGETLENAILEGDVMRDATMLIKLRNSETGFAELFAVNLTQELSFFHP